MTRHRLAQQRPLHRNKMDAAIVIPVFNQLHYTRQCLDSLNACGYPDSMIVVVNNASTDGTKEFLDGRPALHVIHNDTNRACAAAWNQGYRLLGREWTMFLNNDVLVTEGWLESLIDFAKRENLGMACPAMCENELNYNLSEYASEFVAKMKRVKRIGGAHGVAFVVRRNVIETVGGFDENFRKGGNEDEDFFMRVRMGGFKYAVTGSSFIHHFGSITQKHLQASGLNWRDETVDYFRQKWRLNWARRKWRRFCRKATEAWWCRIELLRFGQTLWQVRIKGCIEYR